VDNQSFWNHRYRTMPQLGSGPGSRGYAASYKNDLIHAVVRGEGIRTLFDIGCGDLCWLDDHIARSCSYVGYDISEVVVARNAATCPYARFIVHDITAAPIGSTADLVVSFDVLIHQIERKKFTAALTNILSAIGKVGLISYRTPPLAGGQFPPTASVDPATAHPSLVAKEEKFIRMVNEELPADRPKMETAFHGPLADLIRGLDDNFEARSIGEYRNQTIYDIRPRHR
jgi:hypothetical protein